MSQEKHTEATKFAIVAEGGGQKGIFTAGVLDAFLDAEFWPFHLKVGVSAGAQNLAAYSARARQYARRAIQQLTTTQPFFKPSKFFTGGNVIDLDWYFHQVRHDEKNRFPTAAENLDKTANFYAVATNVDTLEPHYLHTWYDNMFEHLKASSAIPFLYRPGVEVEGLRLMDGGVSDPLPVKWAYEQGAKRILLIRTMEADDDGRMPIMERLKPIMRRVRQSPKMFDMYLHHQRCYAEALDFINNPPEDVEILQIAPRGTLQSMVLGSSAHVLQYDYLVGKREGKRFLRQWQQQLRQRA
ncbi:patatin-like phospholipase family protein [Saliniradius amylolyticus]|uniref:patatin-like phospholipase family protein n=1 Tax=Saliniradius amylolyticus TaxID=2183582 RepID=UPI000D69DEDD|nr:patatin family protein [Saliniradius amylolyticus]